MGTIGQEFEISDLKQQCPRLSSILGTIIIGWQRCPFSSLTVLRAVVFITSHWKGLWFWADDTWNMGIVPISPHTSLAGVSETGQAFDAHVEGPLPDCGIGTMPLSFMHLGLALISLATLWPGQGAGSCFFLVVPRSGHSSCNQAFKKKQHFLPSLVHSSF